MVPSSLFFLSLCVSLWHVCTYPCSCCVAICWRACMHLPVQECGGLGLASMSSSIVLHPKSVAAWGWPLCLAQLRSTFIFWRQALLLNLESTILANLDNHLAPGFSLLSPAGFRITNGLPCFYVCSGDPNSPVLSFAQQAISRGRLLGFLIHVCYTKHETML